MAGGFGVPLIDFSDLQRSIGGLAGLGHRAEAQKLYSDQLDAALAAQGRAPAAQAQTPLAALGTPAATPNLPSFAQAGSGGMGDYLNTIRAKESGGNDLAKNPNSTATGRYQFTSSTWAGLMRQHPELGLTLNGRTDPAQQEKAIRVFTDQNAKALTAAGIPINPQNLYGAHFLGAGGARQFIPGAINNPDAPAASLVGPGVAAANRSVFYNKDGTPKTAAQVYAWMGGQRGGGGQQAPASAPTAPVQVASGQADVPAPGAQTIGFNVPGQGGGDFVPGTEASPALAASRGAAAPAAVGGLSPAGAQRLSAPQVENLRAMLRNPLTQGHAAKIIEGLNKPDEFSFQVVGDQLVRTSKSGRAEVVPNITKPPTFQTFTGPDGNAYVFNPQEGSLTRAVEGRDKQFSDLSTPEQRAAAGIDPSYKGPVQRGPNGELRLPGKATTEVVMPAAEKAQDVKIGTQYGEVFNTAQAEGRSASGQLNTLRLMEKLIENPNFYSGAGSSTFVAAKRAAAALGVPGAQEAVAPNELFAKLASQSVLDKLGGNLGAGVSNADVAFITQTTANAANTPEGNRQIIQFGKALAQRQIDVAKLAREYAKSNGGRLDSGFDERLSQWAQANPLYPEATAAQQAQTAPAPTPGAPAVARPSAPAAPTPGTIMRGYRFKGGNPASPSSWEPVQQGPVT